LIDPKALAVAELLAQKLPQDILRFAKPLPRSNACDPDLLEPWISMQESNRKVELHIRGGGDVELHVYVTGRKRDPREALFVCDGKLDEFTDAMVQDFVANVQRLS
jgi:hypothetical protein